MKKTSHAVNLSAQHQTGNELSAEEQNFLIADDGARTAASLFRLINQVVGEQASDTSENIVFSRVEMSVQTLDEAQLLEAVSIVAKLG